MSNQNHRPRNWKTDSWVLCDDMPREFGDQLIYGADDYDHSLSQHYFHALSGLGALTYAVATATAIAHLPELSERKDFRDALAKQQRASLADPDTQSVEMCVGPLREALGSFARGKSLFGGILTDIAQPHPIDDLPVRLDRLRTSTSQPEHDAQLHNELYDLVSSAFGYWPKYALGFLESGPDPRIRFDTDEIGDVKLRPSQAAAFHFAPEDLLATQPFLDLTNDAREAIEGSRLRTAFLADLENRKIWMISPFILNYVPNAAQKTGIEKETRSKKFPSGGTEYLFLDSAWASGDRRFTWRRFNSAPYRNDILRPDRRQDRGRAIEASLRDRSARESIHDALLQYPREFLLSEDQREDAFAFLKKQLEEVEFVCTEGREAGRSYRVAAPVGTQPTIFYKTGASLYVEVENSTQPSMVAKVLHDEARGIMDIERGRFEAEIRFLTDYFDNQVARDPQWERIGSGIVRLEGAGNTVQADGAHEASLRNRPFYIREHIGSNLRSFIDEVENESLYRPKDPRLAKIWSARRIMRALYVIERAAATLALIYEKTADGSGRHFIHRDIRPEALLYPGEGVIKICDFSAAYLPGFSDNDQGRDIEDYGKRDQDPVMLHMMGMSSHYCAPEIYEKPLAFSPTADVFSLGIILNELLYAEKLHRLPHRERRNVQRTVSEWRQKHGDADWGGIFYDPPGNEDMAVCEEIDSHAAQTHGAEPFENGRYFDLAVLVGKATCSWKKRWSMEEFRNHLAGANSFIRHYLAAYCRKEISRNIDSTEASRLQDVFTVASAVFGGTKGARIPLSMPRCAAACVHCQNYYDDTGLEEKKYACQAPDMDVAVRKLYRAAGQASEANLEERLQISRETAKVALEAIETSLRICPGVIDLVPAELDKAVQSAVGKPMLDPHKRFLDAGKRLFKAAGEGTLSVEPGPPLPPEVNSEEATALATDLLMMIAGYSVPAEYPN